MGGICGGNNTKALSLQWDIQRQQLLKESSDIQTKLDIAHAERLKAQVRVSELEKQLQEQQSKAKNIEDYLKCIIHLFIFIATFLSIQLNMLFFTGDFQKK